MVKTLVKDMLHKHERVDIESVLCVHVFHIIFQFVIAGAFGIVAGKHKTKCLVRSFKNLLKQ